MFFLALSKRTSALLAACILMTLITSLDFLLHRLLFLNIAELTYDDTYSQVPEFDYWD